MDLFILLISISLSVCFASLLILVILGFIIDSMAYKNSKSEKINEKTRQ
jgi:hypothetical protein